MKRLLVVVLLAGILFSCGNDEQKNVESKKVEKPESEIAKEDFDNKMKRYEVESGIIEYNIKTEGNVMGFKIEGKGTKKVVFKDWGAVELVEEKKTENNMGQRSETHNLSKFDNGVTYSVDFKKKQIFKGDQKGMFDALNGSNNNMAETGKEMLESMGGKKIGEESIQSYSCDIWEVMGQKIWLYKGLTLKVEANVMGIKSVEEVSKIDIDISISKKDLVLPDFPVIEMESMQTPKMNKEEKENLKKVKEMSFEEFKEMAEKESELKGLTEKELEQTFEMMQKMAAMMPQ